MLWKIADLIVANAQELIELEILDNGLAAADRQYVVYGVVPDFFRYYAGCPPKFTARRSPPRRRANDPAKH